MKSSIKKEYLPLNGGTVLSCAAKAFANTKKFSYFVITHPKGQEEQAKAALFADKSLTEKDFPNLIFTEGGSTRQSSIFNALSILEKCTPSPDFVLIHDGARPFIDEKTILLTVDATLEHGAAVPALTPTDTQKTKDENGFIKEHLERRTMAAVQTPQGFDFPKLIEAHRKAISMSNAGKEYTDDTEIYGEFAGKVKIIDGTPENIKITWAKDYNAEKAKDNADKDEGKSDMQDIRCGLGYDLHRLVEGRRLVIGGVDIPFEKGEDGHSDGDALLHAITDSLLGASGLGDIGSYFPPEEAKWKDADSAELLKTVWKDVKDAGWNLGNLDCVIKLEKPKFLPQRKEVIASIAKILEVPEDKVFVKAKTGEKLGSVGEGKAIEVWVTALLIK